jgi:hypothetical protein
MTQPVDAAGAVDAQSTRPPLLGKPHRGFPQPPQGDFFKRGHFYFVKNGDISISL